MPEGIEVLECSAQEECERFWRGLREYFERDIFPGEENCYHCSEEYKKNIETLHARRFNPAKYLFFRRGGQEIGLALTVIYDTEDGKQFILEFCVYPEFRGNGTGAACAEALLSWGRENGAKFAELNCSDERRERFWSRFGFMRNGVDAQGESLMLLPPEEDAPMTVGLANGIEEFWALELSFFSAIGETPPDSMGRSRMIGAMSAGRVAFITVKRQGRPVGLCSVSRCFSSLTCWDAGVFGDFYIEPAFRGRGVARMLVEKAAEYCRKQGMQSLSVMGSDAQLGMYRALGFDAELGTGLAMSLPYET